MFDFKSIDIKSLITEALDIERARKTVVSVQVLLDETASPEFQVFVRSGFSSSSVNSRLTVGYYPSQDISVMEGTDLVVMAAGQTSETGAIAATIRQADIPVLVIAEHGNRVIQSAKDAGHPLPSPMRLSRFPQGSHSTKRSRANLPIRSVHGSSITIARSACRSRWPIRSFVVRSRKMRFSSLLRRMPALVCLCSFLAPICPL